MEEVDKDIEMKEEGEGEECDNDDEIEQKKRKRSNVTEDDNDNENSNEGDEEGDGDGDGEGEEGNKTKKKKERKQRRSKQFIEGRTHKCCICNKAYLSRPALHNHQKTKHNPEDFQNLPFSCIEFTCINAPCKKRGRPPKTSQTQLIKIETYFFNQKRKPIENQPPIIRSDQTLSNPFNDFLQFVAERTNQSSYEFIEKIIIPFNTFTHLNASSNEDSPTKEDIYDSIPSQCNHFLRYYKTLDNAVKDKEEIFEMIEIIFIFCIWLLDKEYTSTKIEFIQSQAEQ